MMKKVNVLIVGAGPTGLGAAWRLNELGERDWLMVDSHDYPGGLAASFRDEHGFTWDFAVHVAHSHYHYFDRLMDAVLPDGFYHHQRRSWVRLYGAWVPYPFQFNFHHLPEPVVNECLEGLRHRSPMPESEPTFRNWILSSFGEGIARHFMIPYNQKIWTVDPAEMNRHWLGDRVPTVDMDKVEMLVRERKDEVGWGPNATFQFPKEGGTGAIWKALYEQLPESNKRLSMPLIRLDRSRRIATFSDGSEVSYEVLVSTMPLPVLVRMLDSPDHIQACSGLRYSHVQVAGVGVKRPIPPELQDKTWVYCPEEKARFYRVTPFSTFSPAHTPDPERNCSFLCEFASPGGQGFLKENIGDLAVEGLRELGFMDLRDGEYHIHTMASEYGYPVPTLDRDEILHDVLPGLEAEGIYSRGRFGGWKYEVANMDHSVMQGVEAVNHALSGVDQPTIYRPNEVNKGKR
ncbi:MAG TPA: FAD-dependent oxidoreductase [Kiritimatiellia bacterium]|nr:FAD-dependent oxidoreductase [Kiritimatiellia bacterium]